MTLIDRRAALPLLLAPLAACVPLGAGQPPRLTADGASAKGVYPVTTANVEQVRARALATLNARRQSAGLSAVTLSPELVRAADRHSTSMSAQRRAWLFGPQGDTPPQRAREAGFQGDVLGEVVSETYDSEVRTIEVWLADPTQRAILLDPAARRIGVGIHQDPSMKLWWTLTVAI